MWMWMACEEKGYFGDGSRCAGEEDGFFDEFGGGGGGGWRGWGGGEEVGEGCGVAF